MLTCPNSLLFRVRTSLRHSHPLFSSLSALSLHLSVPVSSASHLPRSMTSHILITVLLSETTHSFPCLSYLCLLPSPPQTAQNPSSSCSWGQTQIHVVCVVFVLWATRSVMWKSFTRGWSFMHRYRQLPQLFKGFVKPAGEKKKALLLWKVQLGSLAHPPFTPFLLKTFCFTELFPVPLPA